ncbi:unnamed protein product [Dovyalis caffra]|uniref:Uncharacterized protein n=1 Tax=Dovyalis caffra TaxID=77055 RepID=A0AAV1S8K1_9ROSI|nr:unnamed protein product [Dovyalis caffra]
MLNQRDRSLRQLGWGPTLAPPSLVFILGAFNGEVKNGCKDKGFRGDENITEPQFNKAWNVTLPNRPASNADRGDSDDRNLHGFKPKLPVRYLEKPATQKIIITIVREDGSDWVLLLNKLGLE